MKLSDYVVRFIAAAGVRHLFLLPGGGCMHLVDSVGKSRKIKFVCSLHEQACAVAADAYGQYTNRLGVALVTTGPGGTNTVTGVAGAWLDSVPCLFLSGQVKRGDMKAGHGVRQMGFQEVGIVGIVSSITKYAVTVTEPESIRYHLEKAVFLAQNGRPGPVWIDIPLDVQAAKIDAEKLRGFVPGKSPSKTYRHALSRRVGEAIGLLRRARRPVILAGNGIRLSGAMKEFMTVIRRLRVPVLTTWKAIDFLAESDPLFAGRPGATGQRGANFTLQNADWLLCLGARLDFGQTGYSREHFAFKAKKIMVDIDPCEIKKMGNAITVPVPADAGDFLREWIRQTAVLRLTEPKEWLRRVKTWQAKYPVVLPAYRREKSGVNLYVFLEILSEEMSGRDLLIPGSSGAASEITMQAFKVKRGMRIFNTEGLGPMGFAVPAAIGGCLAGGRRRTVSIDGDGGFAMNIQELETVKRLKLPVKFFVLNNRGYASIRHTQRQYFAGRFVASDASSGLTLPDVLKVSRAFGLRAEKIKDHSALRRQVRKVLDCRGPVVCEVMISPRQMTAPRVLSSRRADGSMKSGSLEDLWPFLDRREFAAQMRDGAGF